MISPEAVHANAINHGWYDKDNDERNIPEQLCLIHSEVSEALEAYRKNDRQNMGEELADIVIRVFDLSMFLGMDIVDEIEKKHIINIERPYRHGDKTC